MPWIFWLFPITFALHNVEEGIFLPAWSMSAGRFHRTVGSFEFVFALVVLTLLAAVITVAFYAEGAGSLSAYLYFAFNAGMFVNVFFPHLAATIVLRKYCPGLLSGAILLAPATAGILLYGYSHQYFTPWTLVIVTIPFAGLVVGSIPLLFRVGRSLRRTVQNKLYLVIGLLFILFSITHAWNGETVILPVIDGSGIDAAARATIFSVWHVLTGENLVFGVAFLVMAFQNSPAKAKAVPWLVASIMVSRWVVIAAGALIKNPAGLQDTLVDLCVILVVVALILTGMRRKAIPSEK